MHVYNCSHLYGKVCKVDDASKGQEEIWQHEACGISRCIQPARKERYTQIGGVMDIAWSLLHGQNRTWAVVSPHCQGRVMSGYVGPRRPSYEVEFFNMCKDA